MRTERKRLVVRTVFEDFARSLNKPDFQLERFTDTVQKISPASIALLGFIKEVIIPYRDEQIHKDLATKNLGTDKPYDWWFEYFKKTKLISKCLGQWVFNRYSPGGKDALEKYGVKEVKDVPDKEQFRLMDIETAQRNRYNAPSGELTYLGVVANYYSYDDWGGGGMHWTLTDFGYEFIQYIEETEEDKKLIGGNELCECVH